MAITYLDLAEKVMKATEKPMTVREIWEHAESRDWQKELSSIGKTPVGTLSASLYVDSTNRPEETRFKVVGSEPKTWYLKELIELKGQPSVDDSPPVKEKAQPTFREIQLHPFLTYFVRTRLMAYMKTIRHGTSSKDGYAEWLHPDAVACHFAHEEYSSQVTEITTLLGQNTSKLYSFEIKRELGYSNLRQAFFQAVSNSSWAHRGYLVAAVVDDDPGFGADLSRLSTAFGIGVIQLDIDEPDNSSEIFPSRERDQLDIDTMNVLAIKNQDFRTFLESVKGDLDTRRIIGKQYDTFIEKEKLVKTIADHSNRI